MRALEPRGYSYTASIATEMLWEHRTDIVLNVEIDIKLGHVCHRDPRSATRDGRMWGRRVIVTSDDNVWSGVCLSFRARLRRR